MVCGGRGLDDSDDGQSGSDNNITRNSRGHAAQYTECLAIEMFLLSPSPSTLAVYSYLLCCENQNPANADPVTLPLVAISRAVKIHANTVCKYKYMMELEEWQLIGTVSTTVTTEMV